MRGKVTIIIAVLEALVLLVMKTCDWHESKQHKPHAGRAKRAAGKRVVNPDQPEYDDQPPRGDMNAAYFPASRASTDEEIHEEK